MVHVADRVVGTVHGYSVRHGVESNRPLVRSGRQGLLHPLAVGNVRHNAVPHRLAIFPMGGCGADMQPLDGAIRHSDSHFHVEQRLVRCGGAFRLFHDWPERFEDLPVEHAGIRHDLVRGDAQDARAVPLK